MAAAPGHNEHVAGYLQHTSRYSRDTDERKRAETLSFFFRTSLHFGPESIMFVLSYKNSHLDHQVSSRFFRNLEPNEHVRHLSHSARVRDLCFDWIKGLQCRFHISGTQRCNLQARDEILPLL